MDFRYLFVFSWPEYTMAWTSDAFRAFAFVNFLLDFFSPLGKKLVKRLARWRAASGAKNY